MNNICAIGDSHLGYKHKRKAKRLEDFEIAFSKAVEKALKFDPEVIVFLGDLFHYSKPDVKSLLFAMKKLRKIVKNNNNETKIVLCIGNHELEGNLGTSYIPLLSELHENIFVLSSENPHIKINVGDKIVGFHGFEFLRNKKRAQEKLRELSNEVKEQNNDYDILCLHQALQGYLEPYELSKEGVISVIKNYDLVLFGHIHKEKKIPELSSFTPSFYVGSIERTSFNESENENGFLVFSDFNFSLPEYVKIESSPMRRLKFNINNEKMPGEINDFTKETISRNQDVKCLQLTINTRNIKGDFMDIKEDWYDEFPEKFTVLDVSVNPELLNEENSTVETVKIENIEKIIEEESGSDEELKDVCLKLYEKYSV